MRTALVMAFLASTLPVAAGAADMLETRTGSGPDPAKIVKRMDKNGDGKLSPAEFTAPPQRFKMLDADGDGFVTKEEFSAAMKRARGGGSGGAASQNPMVAWYQKLPVILCHTHFNIHVGRGRDSYDDWSGTTEAALASMDSNGVRAVIVMPTPQPAANADPSQFGHLIDLMKSYPARFFASGGGGSLNGMIGSVNADNVSESDRRKFTARADEIVRAGAVGFGETTALHFSFFDGHPFEETRPDHPLYLLLADLAAKYDIPLDLHVEAVPQTWTVSDRLHDMSGANPRRVSENISALERLLGHNPKAKILWVHLGMDWTGQRTVALTRRLLSTYRNLYIAIKGPISPDAEDPLFFTGAGLNPKWRSVFVEFPDRFVIGSDVFFETNYATHQLPDKVDVSVRVVRHPFLPPAVARKIAFENAQRLYKLHVVNVDDYPLPAGAQTAHKNKRRKPAAGGQPDGAKPGEMVGPRGRTARQVIANYDNDGDGKIARKEFTGNANAFPRLDADGDGFITKEELETRWRKLKARKRQQQSQQ